MKNLYKAAALLLVTSSLGGCIAAVGAAGVTGVQTANEDRSVGSKVDDNAIALSINNKFLQKDKNIFADVTTSVHEGRVLLTGKVQKPADAKDAEDLTWQVGGVKEVINDIKVANEEDFGNYISDAWISNEIRTRLLFAKGIRSSNYGVQTVDRVVYLMGIAQNEKELEAAIAVSRNTKDVSKVISHVVLKDDPRRGIWARPQATTTDNEPTKTSALPHDGTQSDPVN